MVVAVRSRRLGDAEESLRMLAPLGISEFVELTRQLFATQEASEPNFRADIQGFLSAAEVLRVGPVRVVPKAEVRTAAYWGRAWKLTGAAVAAGVCIAMALAAWRNSQIDIDAQDVVPRRPVTKRVSSPNEPPSSARSGPDVPVAPPSSSARPTTAVGAGASSPSAAPKPRQTAQPNSMAPNPVHFAEADALLRWLPTVRDYQTQYARAALDLVELQSLVVPSPGVTLKQLVNAAAKEQRSPAGQSGKATVEQIALSSRLVAIRASPVWNSAAEAISRQASMRDIAEVGAIAAGSGGGGLGGEYVEALGDRVHDALDRAGTLDLTSKSNFVCDAVSLCVLLDAARVLSNDPKVRGLAHAPDRVASVLTLTIAGIPNVPDALRKDAAEMEQFRDKLRAWKSSTDPLAPQVWYSEAVALRQAGLSYAGGGGQSSSRWLLPQSWAGLLQTPTSTVPMTPIQLLQALLRSPAAPSPMDAKLSNLIQRALQQVGANMTPR